jgi:hypothetical protein
MELPWVYADFHNADEHGRLRLDSPGTREDLARQGLALAEGLPLLLYGDDAQADGTSGELVVEGVVEADAATGAWVARLDWNAIRHEALVGGGDASAALNGPGHGYGPRRPSVV